MLSILLSLFNPVDRIVKSIARMRLEAVNAETEQKRIEAEENIKALEVQRDVLIAEQSNPVTRWVRPLWALAPIIYTWKIFVWDKVLGWGVTDPLDERMWGLMMLIAGSYFVSRSAEKIVNRIWR